MRKNARLAAAIAAACPIGLAVPAALAQEQELATVTVTGSLIPTTPDAVAVPVITLDAKQLEQYPSRPSITSRFSPTAPPRSMANNADVATFSPIGRLVYGIVAYTF